MNAQIIPSAYNRHSFHHFVVPSRCGSVTLGDKQPFRLFVKTLAPLRYLRREAKLRLPPRGGLDSYACDDGQRLEYKNEEGFGRIPLFRL